MIKLIHLSDLHFGTQHAGIADLVSEKIQQLQPDLIVITGDFTQRALRKQYQNARTFLDSLNTFKILTVPGNHDISLHNLIERFFYPFNKYKKYICSNLNPTHVTNSVAIFGLTSATPYRAQDGEVSTAQLIKLKSFFSQQPMDVLRIVYLHHNLIKSHHHRIIHNSKKLLETFRECKVNLVLSGHLHFPHFEIIKINDWPLYTLTAGTPTSWRLWGVNNSFNCLEIDGNNIKVLIYELKQKKFSIENQFTFTV